MPPQEILKIIDAWKCYFQRFPDSTWALWTKKIQTILTIFYVYYNHSFPQNLNHWLLEKSEVINLQMLIHGEWKNVFSNACLGFFGADAILGHAKAWDLVLWFTLWKCPGRSMTLRSASTFKGQYIWNSLNVSLRWLRHLSRMFDNYFCGIFSLFLSQFLAESCSLKMLQAFHDPSINFHRAWER